RRDEQHRRARAPVAIRGVVPQPVDGKFGDNVVGRGLLVGLEAAEARHLERVLGGSPKPGNGPRDRLRDQIHRRRSTSSPNARAGASDAAANAIVRVPTTEVRMLDLDLATVAYTTTDRVGWITLNR